MSFEALVSNLSELDGLMKSMEAAQTDGALENKDDEDEDDAAIAAAAGDASEAGAAPADAGADAAEADPDLDDLDDLDGDDGIEPEDEDEDEPVMGKSFAVKTADGAVVQAIDGAAAILALQRQMRKRDEVMSKALSTVTALLKSQNEVIKSLRAEVARGGMAGRGRKAALTVHDKPAVGTLQKSQPAGLSGQEFLLKALDAQRAGRITGTEVAIAEAALNAGQQVPEHIARKVIG